MKMLRPASAALMVLMLAGFAAAQSRAKSCGLNIEVQESNADGPPVQFASATATSVRTKRRFRAVLFEGMPAFGTLPAGRYNVTVSKRGYKTAVKEVDLTCAGLEPDDPSMTENVFLQKVGAAGTGAVGGASAVASGIRDIDFLNFTYQPSVCSADIGLPRTVKVAGGEFKDGDNFYNVRREEIGYGDLNGDGGEEAVVQIRCGSSAGTLRAFEVQAFTLRGGRATLLARLDSDRVEGDYKKTYPRGVVFYPGEHAPKVEGGRLIFEALTDGSFASPANVATFDYRLAGSRFVLTGRPKRAKRQE